MSKPYVPIKLASEEVGKVLRIESDNEDWKHISLELSLDDCDKAHAKKFGKAIMGMPKLTLAALLVLKEEESLFAVSPKMAQALGQLRRALKASGIQAPPAPTI